MELLIPSPQIHKFGWLKHFSSFHSSAYFTGCQRTHRPGFDRATTMTTSSGGEVFAENNEASRRCRQCNYSRSLHLWMATSDRRGRWSPPPSCNPHEKSVSEIEVHRHVTCLHGSAMTAGAPLLGYCFPFDGRCCTGVSNIYKLIWTA